MSLVATRLTAEASSFLDKPLFDEEMSSIYESVFQQHYHDSGPWKLMGDELKKVNPQSVLDIASGPGEPAASIAQAMPNASVLSTDITKDMTSKAERMAVDRGLRNMKTEIVDMNDLSAFADESFDVVTCCYGFMFTDTPKKAFAETYRVLKPGGKLITTVWVNVPLNGSTKYYFGSRRGGPGLSASSPRRPTDFG